MKTIHETEFKKNMKRYLDIAEKEKLIIRSSKGSSFVILPIEEAEESYFYYPELQNKIDKAREEKKEGKLHRLTPKLKKELFSSIS